MNDRHELGSPISVNRYGSFYKHGKEYSFSKKWDVAVVYFRLWEANWPLQPSMASLAKHARVNRKYATKVINELTVTGYLINPSATKGNKNQARGCGLGLTLEEEVFLLALRIECPSRPNTDYVAKLKDYYGKEFSATRISVWFRERYEYAGTFKVPNLVPIDKWMMRNATRVMAFRATMDMFPDHSKWNFLDEKHIVNGDTLPKKVRADPLTGYVDAIPVSGDF